MTDTSGKKYGNPLDLLADADAPVKAPNNTSADASATWDFAAQPAQLVQHISDLAARFLNVEAMNPMEDFFNAGGSSVQGVELASVLARELNMTLSLDEMFADSRPIKLAQRWLKAQGMDFSIDELEKRYLNAVLNNDGADGPKSPATGSVQSAVKRVQPPQLLQDFSMLDDDLAEIQRRDIGLILEDIQCGDHIAWLDQTPKEIPKVILLTGATGFLGSHVLFDLLKFSDAHIICLVRAKDHEHGLQRLKDELAVREFRWSTEVARRVDIAVGDLGKERLGLDANQWQQYAQTVDAIVNVAAAVDFVRGYNSLRHMNVLGVKTLADFATTGKIKVLHQVSSLAVFDELGIQSIGEDEPKARISKLFSGYDKTKWASEALLERAREHGLCVTFLRPGGISGNTHNGVYNPLDLSSGLIAAFQSLRRLPEFRYMNLAPVNWISRIIAQIVVDPEAWGYNYHLIGEPVTLRSQLRELTLSGMATQVMSFADWRDYFLKIMEEQPIQELEFLALALKNKTTVKLMEAVFDWPPATAHRVDALIEKHSLPPRPKNDGMSQLNTLRRLEKDGRARLPGRRDKAYLQFDETMLGSLTQSTALISKSANTPANTPANNTQIMRRGAQAQPLDCEFRFTLSVASFLQLFTDRRLDVHGAVSCQWLHPEPLTVTEGNLLVRPDDGVPLSGDMVHPLMKYELTLVDVDAQEWWLSGTKYASSGGNPIVEARTLNVELGKMLLGNVRGEALASGVMKVPMDTYVDQQIKGIQINQSVPQSEQNLARAVWLAWFGGQLAAGFMQPTLRVVSGLLEALRTTRDKGERH